MSADVRLTMELLQHPKFRKVVRALGADGGLAFITLIAWAGANRPSGDLAGLSDEDLELAVDWRGAPDKLVQVLAAVGFLDGQEMERRLHDWAEHQPWAAGSPIRSAKARWNAIKKHHGEAEADRQVPDYAASRRAGSTGNANTEDAASTAASTPPAAEIDAPSPSPSPSPSPKPNPKKVASAPTPQDVLSSMSDVDQQVLIDWVGLRKAKKAPVTQTVIAGARAEAQKAGLTLEAFLRIWCMRGSQGLQADWLKPHEIASAGTQAGRRPSSHTGFDQLDYHQGVTHDGCIV